MAGEPEVQRSIRLFAVLCETTNGNEDLKQMEQWADDRIANAPRSPRRGQSVTVASLDDDLKIIRFNTNGSPVSDVHKLIEEWLDVEEGNT